MSAPHHYVHHNYPPNAHQHSTLFPSVVDGGFESNHENDLLSDDPLGNTINIVGLLVALLVSVIIIVGVAFVIRKIRKRQGPVDDDNEAGVDQSTKAVSGTFPEMVTVHPSADAVQGDEQTPQVFTITFTAVPKKQKMYIRALPKFLRPKPKQVDIEKIKRELGHVYVY